MRVLLSSNEESQSLLCQNIQEKKLLKPFEMCGFGKIGCLMVKQL